MCVCVWGGGINENKHGLDRNCKFHKEMCTIGDFNICVIIELMPGIGAAQTRVGTGYHEPVFPRPAVL